MMVVVVVVVIICYLLEHPACCLVHSSCLIIILFEVKPNLSLCNKNYNILSHITETSKGGASSCFIQKRCWEKSISFLSLSLMSLLWFSLMFLSVSLSAFLSASVFLSLLLSLSAFSFSLRLSPLSFLPLTLFLPHLYLYTSLSSLSRPSPSFPTSTPPLVSSLSLLLAVPLGASLGHLLYSVSLPPTFLFVGYNSWQPRVSGWPLTVCMKISAGGPIETRIALLPCLQQKRIYPSPPGVSKILFCPCRYPGTLFHPDVLDSKWILCDNNKHYSFTYLLCSRPCAAYLL